ncbi:MAG: hypothetical protein RIS70_3667 [Planctomycetota bacterium]
MTSIVKKTGVLLALVMGAAFGAGSVTLVREFISTRSHADDVSREAREQLAKATDLSKAFELTAKAMHPSVVSITSVRKMRMPRRARPEVPDEFRRFFGDDPFDRFFQMPERDQEQQGLGSGVIVSEDGYIVTNNHVIDGADDVTVMLHDRHELKAEVVGRDKDTDLAVLKIKSQNLVPAPLGNSDEVAVGQWVLAVGTPMNLRQSVTAGIISATGRSVGITGGGFEDFLQTDAAINPGNSGGPLVNLRGEVIGINTAIKSVTGGFMGIGFAIPSNMVRSVMDQIVKGGKVVRGRIGAVVSDVSEDVAEKLGYKSTSGALVQDVVTDGPAAKAGLEAGDIVTRYQGSHVETSNQFRNAVAATKPGTKAEIELMRNGSVKTVTVEIGELNGNASEVAQSEAGDVEKSNELGLAVQTLTPDLARQIGSKEMQGVIITQVEPGSLAQRAGLAAGDVITSVNRKGVQTAQEYRDLLRAASVDKGILLQVRRDGVNRFVVIRSR